MASGPFPPALSLHLCRVWPLWRLYASLDSSLCHLIGSYWLWLGRCSSSPPFYTGWPIFHLYGGLHVHFRLHIDGSDAVGGCVLAEVAPFGCPVAFPCIHLIRPPIPSRWFQMRALPLFGWHKWRSVTSGPWLHLCGWQHDHFHCLMAEVTTSRLGRVFHRKNFKK